MAGCNKFIRFCGKLRYFVSILTQPFGWVQRSGVDRLFLCEWFQSSPSLLAGCNGTPHYKAFYVCPFQSSPSLLAGCNEGGGGDDRGASSFNPHPAFWLGATVTPICSLRRSYSFNPHPAFWLGATKSPIDIFPAQDVSILTQPFGWVQHQLSAQFGSPVAVSILTQPFGWVQHPATPFPRGELLFQSSPSLLAGCNERTCNTFRIMLSFNPHPAFWLGATFRP